MCPVSIDLEYDPIIYKDAHYVTCYDEFAAAMAEPEPPFPIAKDVIEGYFDPGETPAYKRMADLLEDVYKNPPRDEPMGDGFTPHFNKLKFCALAGVHFLYRRGWEPKKLFAFCPPLANFAQRIYGYVDKAHVTPEQVAAMEARIKPFVKYRPPRRGRACPALHCTANARQRQGCGPGMTGHYNAMMGQTYFRNQEIIL